MVWFDRAGKQLEIAVPPASITRQRLSSDDGRLLLQLYDAQSGNTDLFVRDLKRAVTSRLTFDQAVDSHPVWSPDGGSVVWLSLRGGKIGIYQKLASGAGQDELLLTSDGVITPRDWSSDRRFIVYTLSNGENGRDVWALPLEGERKPFPILQSPYTESAPRVSPDCRWLAYSSNETGRFEVYVTTFPSAGAKWPISTGGGELPQWRRDGKELFYIAPDGTLMAVTVEGGASFGASAPRPLFEVRRAASSLEDVGPYDVSADGQRFLVRIPVGDAPAAPLAIVVNWTAEIKR